MSELTGTRPGVYRTPAKDDAERALLGELPDEPAVGTVEVSLSERLRERRTQGRSRTHQAAPPPPPGDSAPPPPPRHPRPPGSPPKHPEIQKHKKRNAQKVKVYVTDDHAATAAETWEVLLNADIPDDQRIYVQAGKRLATVGEVKVRTSEGEEWRTSIEPMTRGALIEAVCHDVRFVRTALVADEQGGTTETTRATDIPARALTVFEERYPRRAVPDIAGVASAPVAYMKGGRVHIQTAKGYNRDSGIYLDSDWTQIPELAPKEAAKEIEDWLIDFRYNATTDRLKMRPSDFCNAIAAALTPFVRPLIRSNIPLFYFKAPAQGSGKSKLASVLMWPALGGSLPVSGLAESEDEREKVITSTLLSGAPVCNFDNIKGSLSSPALERLLTSEEWRARLLGGNTIVQLPNDALWLLTANNLTISEDMGRRSLCVQIDPGCPDPHRPENRQAYKHPDQPQYTASIRTRLVACFLSLIRHWVLVGCPRPHTRLEGFDKWSNVVGGILCAAGMSEWWLQDRDDLFEADQTGRDMRALVTLWALRHGAEPVTCRDLLRLLDGKGDTLNEVLALAEPKQAQKMGYLLRDIMGRTYDVQHTSLGSLPTMKRWRVSKDDTKRDLMRYRLESIAHTG